MADQAANELLSTQKASDSGLQVVLHPLPILEISDQIVRAYQRGLGGAIVGALLGQQHGREVTIEHSFSCRSAKNPDGLYELDEGWFRQRLDQMKLVHKSPLLDLVGWYALVPATGPSALHLPIHRQIAAYNESAVLLGFHIDDVLDPQSGALPITIYESALEADDREPVEGEDREMKDAEAAAKMALRFRKLPYTTDTGEAEMIAMQFVRGGATAAVDSTERHILEQFDKKIAVDDGKGKRRAVACDDGRSKKDAAAQPAASPDANLRPAEAEYMAALQAKYNAVKMMTSRLALFIAYLRSLPPDFTAGRQTTADAAAAARASGGQHTVPSNNVLRRMQALVTNAGLVAPPEQATLEREIRRETNDVELISLAADLLDSVRDVRDTCRKFSVADAARHQRQARGAGAQYEQALLAGYEGVDPGFGGDSAGTGVY